MGWAAWFLTRSEKDITNQTTAVRAFDLHARETADALAELRAGQQAYVAAGQGVAFWMPKVATTIAAVRTGIVSLRQAAASGPARSALMEAEADVAEFDAVDRRARDYLTSGDQLMAADVIFTEGGAATAAARKIEAARLAELQLHDSRRAALRTRQAVALSAAGAVAGLVLLLLALTSAAGGAELAQPAAAVEAGRARTADPASPPLRTTPSAEMVRATLKTASDLCTDFGRVREVSDLRDLLARAADAMDASGLVVWLGSTSGADLQPIVSHGYTPQVIARLPSVPRAADNAAAAAYRTGDLQIVLARPGRSSGALVAPLLSADGSIGALSAEIRNGGEGSESTQALAVIFAAHLASIFVAAATDTNATAAASSQ